MIEKAQILTRLFMVAGSRNYILRTKIFPVYFTVQVTQLSEGGLIFGEILT